MNGGYGVLEYLMKPEIIIGTTLVSLLIMGYAGYTAFRDSLRQPNKLQRDQGNSGKSLRRYLPPKRM